MTVTQYESSELDLLRESARDFVQKECNEWLALEWDRDGVYPKHVFDRIARMGWYGVALPHPEWGAGGALELMVVSEELGRGSTDLVACFSLTSSGLRTLVNHGTDEQIARIVPAAMDGAVRLSVAVTEPGGGADAAALTTAARRDGDAYVVRGQKTY